MRPVSDGAGTRYLLLRVDDGSALVRDVDTGARSRLPLETLAALPGSPLSATGKEPDAPPQPLDRAPSDPALGLLVELRASGPRAVRDLLAETTLCESDLHGMVADLRAAGLVREASIGGERGYDLTAAAASAFATLE
ncbi:MAG: hypothetical protein V5A43_01680 [Haloarculaceae archaeon]